MKNIESILTELGVELTSEQKTTLTKEVAENYKTVADQLKFIEFVFCVLGEVPETLRFSEHTLFTSSFFNQHEFLKRLFRAVEVQGSKPVTTTRAFS